MYEYMKPFACNIEILYLNMCVSIIRNRKYNLVSNATASRKLYKEKIERRLFKKWRFWQRNIFVLQPLFKKKITRRKQIRNLKCLTSRFSTQWTLLFEACFYQYLQEIIEKL